MCHEWHTFSGAERLASSAKSGTKNKETRGRSKRTWPSNPQIAGRKNWSQSDFARALQLAGWDVERSVITKIELRRRCITDYELLLMVRTLGVPLSSLRTPKASELNLFF
jgi:hypothetical protein